VSEVRLPDNQELNDHTTHASSRKKKWEAEHQERRKEIRQRYEEKYRKQHGRYRDRSRWGTRAIPLRYYCEICKRRKRPTIGHHIIPRSEGGSNEASNLIEVRRPHHDHLEMLYYDFKRKILEVNPSDRKSYVMKVCRRNRRRYPVWKPLFPKLTSSQSYAIDLRRSKIQAIAEARKLTSDGSLEWFSSATLHSVPEFRSELLRFLERHRNAIISKRDASDKAVFDTIRQRLVDGIGIERPVETEEGFYASDTLWALHMLFHRRNQYHTMFHAFTKPLTQRCRKYSQSRATSGG